jgi:hypothetical protein
VNLALREIEAARTTYLHYVVHELSSAISLDTLDSFHRVDTVKIAAKVFVDQMVAKNVAAISDQCLMVYTSWITELVPHINSDSQMKHSIARTYDLLALVSSGITTAKAEQRSNYLPVIPFCEAAFMVPGLDQGVRSELSLLSWKASLGLELAADSNSHFHHFRTVVALWKDSLAVIESNTSFLPHEAKAFEMFLSEYFEQLQHIFSDVSAKESPFACAAEHLLIESGKLFVSMKRHHLLAQHIQTVIYLVLHGLVKLHTFISSSESWKASRVLEVFVYLEPVVLGCATMFYDEFQLHVADSNPRNLVDAVASKDIISIFQMMMNVTEPVIILIEQSGIVFNIFSVQSQIHSAISKLIPSILESYIAKYQDNFSQYDKDSELPCWFAPVKSLSVTFETAVRAIQSSQLSKSDFARIIPAPKLASHTSSDLFCLRIYLRMFSSDQLCESPSFIVDQLISLCSHMSLFSNERSPSTTFVPSTHFDQVLEVTCCVAAKYCYLSQEAIGSIVKATDSCRKQIIAEIARISREIKSSNFSQRAKAIYDFDVACLSLRATCDAVKRILSKSSPLLFREEAVLHVVNLCQSALTILCCEDLDLNQCNTCLESVVCDIPIFLQRRIADSPAVRSVYDDIKDDAVIAGSNDLFCHLLLSLLSPPGIQLHAFSEDFVAWRIRLQDSLLDKNRYFYKFMVRLHRMEFFVRSSEMMIVSHFGCVTDPRDSAVFPAVMRNLPSFFLVQFQKEFQNLFVIYESFIAEKLAWSTQKQKIGIPAQKLADFSDFLGAFQVGSVQNWFERVTGASLSSPLVASKSDQMLRPFVVAHFMYSLVTSGVDSTFGVFQPSQLLQLCATASVPGSSSEVRRLRGAFHSRLICCCRFYVF